MPPTTPPTHSPTDAPDPFPHLPRNAAEAQAWATKLEQARSLLRDGEYQGRLTCVLGVAKSASRKLTGMLAELHENPAQRRAIFAPSYSPSFRTFELRPETAAEFPDGGVLHIQAPLTTPTLAALRTLGANYVVLIRHPADQVCAYTCFTRYLHYRQTCAELSLDPQACEDPPLWQQRREALTVSHFIGQALHRALGFMADWLDWHQRDDHPPHLPHPRGTVLRYEDFIADPRGQLARVHRDLHCVSPDDDRLDVAVAQFAPNADMKRRLAMPGVYPHGDTGRAELWRDFFDADTAAHYRRVAEAFAVLHPAADLLEAHYPDWQNPA